MIDSSAANVVELSPLQEAILRIVSRGGREAVEVLAETYEIERATTSWEALPRELGLALRSLVDMGYLVPSFEQNGRPAVELSPEYVGPASGERSAMISGEHPAFDAQGRRIRRS